MIVALMCLQSEKHVLVCAYQNETADLLYQALEAYGFLKDKLLRVYSTRSIQIKQQHQEPCMRNSYHEIFAKEELKVRIRLKLDPEDELPKKEKTAIIRKIFNRFRVIVTTCGTASNKRDLFVGLELDEDEELNFERVLMDEATMIKECDSVVPLKNCK